MWIGDSFLVLSFFFILELINLCIFLQEVSLPILSDSIMEALKILLGI
jgi:hypothetical protein